MKQFIICLLLLVLGYALGNLFPYTDFIGEQTVKGGTEVKVLLQDEQGIPVVNVEIDIAETPGPPPQNGVAHTNNNGVAIFSLNPGNYFIFFNSSNFPEGFREPAPEPIIIQEGMQNEFTVTLEKE